MKNWFFLISLTVFLFVGSAALIHRDFVILFGIILPLFLLGVYDVLQRKHTILRNFPVIGHLRFMLEFIRPEIYQYFIESDLDGTPFNRERRSVVYERAKGDLDTLPYGTRWDVYRDGHEWINHSLTAHGPTTDDPRIMVGGEACEQPYNASILNISAMSFGSLSKNAIEALNLGAKVGGFAHNTGEGGLSPYHLKHGGDIIWQLGTAYFGCRRPDGRFDPDIFQEKANLPQVKMIEIKLSQGAKPGHGGILPAGKLTEEISKIRMVAMGKDVLSPPTHSEFSTPIELMEFIVKLRELTHGKPIGFKLCLGNRREFFSICKAMLETRVTPDFITVDGAEGGTGAAPLEFANAIGTPLNEALAFVNNALISCDLRDKIRVICSGKLMTGMQFVSKLALGADMCNSARGMMLALGCIQSLKCNSNRCPTGVTSQDPALVYGLNIQDKYQRVARFHRDTVKAIMEMIGAAGLATTQDLKPGDVYRRISPSQVRPLDRIYHFDEPGGLLRGESADFLLKLWDEASAERFA